MRWVNVPHFKSGTLTRQTAGSKGRQAALVRNFRQWVCLIHKLTQLRGAKELLNHRGSRLVVNEIMGKQRVDVLQLQPLTDRPLDAKQTDAVLVFQQLANGPYATVAQVIDVVDLAVAILQLKQVTDGFKDVILGQGALLKRQIQAEALV